MRYSPIKKRTVSSGRAKDRAQMPRDNNAAPALGSALLPPAKMPTARGRNNIEAPSGYYGPVPDDPTGFYADVPSNAREQNNDQSAWRETAVIPRDLEVRSNAQPAGLVSNRFAQEGLRPIGINQRIAALNEQQIGRVAPQPSITPANTSRLGINLRDALQANNSRPGVNPPNHRRGTTCGPASDSRQRHRETFSGMASTGRRPRATRSGKACVES
jgi:hypothetical protein